VINAVAHADEVIERAARCMSLMGSFTSILTSPPHVRIDTPISDMVRVAAITEADIARAPMSKPAPKRSPDIVAKAVGGNRLRFRRLGFLLKFSE
jgi:hypothetical protein